MFAIYRRFICLPNYKCHKNYTLKKQPTLHNFFSFAIILLCVLILFSFCSICWWLALFSLDFLSYGARSPCPPSFRSWRNMSAPFYVYFRICINPLVLFSYISTFDYIHSIQHIKITKYHPLHTLSLSPNIVTGTSANVPTRTRTIFPVTNKK